MKRIILLLVLPVALLALSSSPARAAKGDLIEPSKVGDSIRISVGQEFAVAFDQRGDRLTSPHRVHGVAKGPVVTLKFFVPPDHKNILVLVIGSSYPRIVRYRAAARTKTRREFYETNMLSLNPNIPVYEGWSDPFVELVLFDFHLTNEKPLKSA